MPSPDIRASLVTALHSELVGPFDPAHPNEVLETTPSRWYLTGFLAPQGGREADPTDDDELGGGDDQDDEAEASQEPEPKQKSQFPASLGLSIFLPCSTGTGETIKVTVTYADYMREERVLDETDKRTKKTLWQRIPRAPQSVEIALDERTIEKGKLLTDADSIRICGKLETADTPGLEKGTRALSLFVVNERTPDDRRGHADERFMFQVQLEVEFARGFVSRPSRRGEDSVDHDDRTADLQFRESCEWAVGHGVAIEGIAAAHPTVIRTTWIPQCEVRNVVTHDESTVTTSMDKLGKEQTGDELRSRLLPLVDKYDAWIKEQLAITLDSPQRAEFRGSLMKRATRTGRRVREGIDLLATQPDVREAFQLMNRAMATAARKRSPDRYAEKVPEWRLFQLAFVLLSLNGIAREAHADRQEVELIFFPTGGGKTEAYLGVIGFTLLLRRMRGQSRPDAGLGVAVLLRYTLRLLTLDQLGRAATLICALELLRKEDPTRFGSVRFSVGLWVGRSATANTLDQVKKQILDYKNSQSKDASSPFPLPNCPWCGKTLGKSGLILEPSKAPTEVIVHCTRPDGEGVSDCDFSPRKNPEGLPVVFVDEQIYRELPCFIVATVDKFAMMPWRGETGMLFGQANAREGRKSFGPMDRTVPKDATALPNGYLPPELIVQDELHLISGPLGTMVGLYETAIDFLSTRTVDGKEVGPKIIASTATVRRAQEQITALFDRQNMSLFPPPGVNDSETFFAKLDREKPGRLYIGVAAPGRAQKAILLRTYVALLCAAERQYKQATGKKSADAYMTLAGYFNNLRELGGMRRLVEDDVRTRGGSLAKRVPFEWNGPHPWGANRIVKMPVELTSREKSSAIKQAKDRLAQPHSSKDQVDVLLASNMISVGVDIDRLGLMVVAGQPKTTSEYIQASSRVGRQHPGLVVTCFNTRRPRDRSHYERFVAYHECFYRYVEATSLTPFSGPALDRGLTGTLLSMVRLASAAMTPAKSAMDIEAQPALVERCVKFLSTRSATHNLNVEADSQLPANVRKRGEKLVETWIKLVREARDKASKRSYSPYDGDKSAGTPLLFSPTDQDPLQATAHESRFAAPTSMRDVEPTVHLWVERDTLRGQR